MTASDFHGEGRYAVVRYADKRGRWFAVIDKQAIPSKNIVAASRSPRVAHKRADELNATRADVLKPYPVRAHTEDAGAAL